MLQYYLFGAGSSSTLPIYPSYSGVSKSFISYTVLIDLHDDPIIKKLFKGVLLQMLFELVYDEIKFTEVTHKLTKLINFLHYYYKNSVIFHFSLI